MSFKQNLIYARSHIIFLLGLAVAFGIVIQLERLKVTPTSVSQADVRSVAVALEKEASVERAPSRVLTPTEMAWAEVAWKYFENNYQASTGLVNSVDGFESTTLWDTSSYLMGLVSAYRLGIIPKATFNSRLTAALKTLAGIPLFDGALPNKAYNTRTGDMATYANETTERGIGWSAIDIARFMVPMHVIIWNYPEHAPTVKEVIRRWDMDQMLQDGTMYGSRVNEAGETVLVQEGRLGYEEYAAKSMILLGFDATTSREYLDFVKFVDIYGVSIAVDSRDPERFQAHNYVVSEPYVLDGIELGWDQWSTELAGRIYEVQAARYAKTGELTAVSEDHIDQAPWFVYNTVYTDGASWNAITEDGADASEFRTLSTKAAFGWHALYDTAYTEKLMEIAKTLHDPAKGWYSGRYEGSGKTNKSLSANTNAIVLETLAYRQFGKLVAVYE